MATFPLTVEIWDSLLNKYRGDLPVNFLKAWMTRESNGNPCSWTSLREAGIFQLMQGSNQSVAGTSEAALRAACQPAPSQSVARPLTAAEAEEQVRSGVAYVNWARNYARAALARAGANWSEDSKDFGKMVMFVHILPAKIAPWLTAATAGLGHPPRNWNELVPFAAGQGISQKWIDHANWIGSHWSGVTIPVMAVAILGGSALLYYLYRRQR